MKRFILSALSIICAAGVVDAQGAGALAGKWRVEYERGRRIENGEATSIMGTATVTITPSGDSLLATFDSGPRRDGSAAPPSTVSGRMTPAGAVFVQKQSVQLNMNGDLQTREITLTWSLRAVGDVLTGSLERVMPTQSEPLPTTPVKGTRIVE